MKNTELDLKIYNFIIYILILTLGILIAYILIFSNKNDLNDITLLMHMPKIIH